MSRNFFRNGTCVIVVLFTSCTPQEGILTKKDLPPCTVEGSPFEAIPFQRTPAGGLEYLWPKEYHRRTAEVVDAHSKQFAEGLTTGGKALQCDANELLQPTAELAALASVLHPWRNGTVSFSERDVGSVLSEYHRVYECALLEEQKFFPTIPGRSTWCCPEGVPGNACTRERTRTCMAEGGVPFETLDECLSYGCAEPSSSTYGQDAAEEVRRTELLKKEIEVSRRSLQRTLAYLTGIDRLHPLSLELHCLARTSLELRNILGLTAEAASCLPRVLDARGSLRAGPAVPPAAP